MVRSWTSVRDWTAAVLGLRGGMFLPGF